MTTYEGKLHRFKVRSFSKSDKVKRDMYDKNGEKFKFLILKIGDKEYQKYYKFNDPTPDLSSFLGCIVTIESASYTLRRSTPVSITNGLTEIIF